MDYYTATNWTDRETDLAALASPASHTPIKLASWAHLLVRHGRTAGLISRRLTKG